MSEQTQALINKFEEHHKSVLKLMEDANKAAKEAAAETDARLAEIEQKVVRRSGGGTIEMPKTLGQSVVDAPAFKSFIENGARGSTRVEVKTTATITSGATLAGPGIVPDIRVGDWTPLARRPLKVRNLIAPGNTTSNSIWFPRMTARQNNAAAVAEGAAKPYSDFTMSLIQTPVATIAHLMKASRQALDDAVGLQSLIDSELTYGCDLTEETQLLVGDGSGANLLGLIPQATAYSAAFTVTGETAIDRIALALLQAELALLPASGIVLHPTDYRRMSMLKDGMGKYILGDPTAPPPMTLWGVPLSISLGIPVGTFLVGAFMMASQIFDRLLMEVLVSTENSTDFENNLITVRGEKRLALACKRPQAFITGTLP